MRRFHSDLADLLQNGTLTARSDGDLLALVARGSGHPREEAFRVLVGRHTRSVMSVCVISPDPNACFQETFRKLCEQAEKIKDADSLGAWLLKVAEREALSALKRARRESSAMSSFSEPKVDDDSPLSAVITREHYRILHELLQDLDESDRETIYEIYFNYRTQSDLARERRVSQSAIHQRVKKILDRLRADLDRRGVSASITPANLLSKMSWEAIKVTPTLIKSTVKTATRVSVFASYRPLLAVFLLCILGSVLVASGGPRNWLNANPRAVSAAQPKISQRKGLFRPLTAAEGQVVRDWLAIVRECQLDDGGMNQFNHGHEEGSQVWIATHFDGYANLALLANHERNPGDGDLDRVTKWLDWCVAHQDPEGFWFEYAGVVGDYKSNGKIEAWNSSAAMILTVLDRYRQVGGVLKPEYVTSAKKALACIEKVTDADGLTWARPDYHVKFLISQVDTYAGLRSAASLFAATGEDDHATKAKAMADRMATKLPSFWRPSEKLFALALLPNGRFEVSLNKAYPDGLAQLFGVAFVSPQPDALKAASKFTFDTVPEAAFNMERWLVAASRLGGETAKEWRRNMVADASTFVENQAYAYRPAGRGARHPRRRELDAQYPR